MYIKGISKVVIVITIILSVFLVIPSKVEAVFEAPYTCSSGYVKVSTPGPIGIGNWPDTCCPDSKLYTSLISASGIYSTVSILGSSYREVGSGAKVCKVKYNAQKKDGTILKDQVFSVNGEDGVKQCPVNFCYGKPDIGQPQCFGQLEAVNSSADSRVCCVEKKGNPGRITTRADCQNPDMSVASVFSQLPKEVTADEICTKDSGAGNADDKRSSGEKGRIYGECIECLRNSNYLWTGVGCMEASLNGLITTIIRIFYGIITALMLLKIIIAGYKFYGGDPEQLKDSKMEIFSAIGAAFALTLGIIALRYIGIDILGLGGIDGVSSGLPILK